MIAPPTRARREGRPRVSIAMAVALGLATLPTTGCSFRLMRPAPPPSTWPDPVVPSSSEEKCTETEGPPVADTVLVGGLGTLTYLERNAGSQTVTLGLAVVAVPFLVSAIYGYVEASRCHRYHARFNQQGQE